VLGLDDIGELQDPGAGLEYTWQSLRGLRPDAYIHQPLYRLAGCLWLEAVLRQLTHGQVDLVLLGSMQAVVKVGTCTDRGPVVMLGSMRNKGG
jgi:hypothetical protein